MTKISVLIGNGLSIALSNQLSLPIITKRFYNRLNPEQKTLIDSSMSDKKDKSDFEKCIASVEKYYEALHHHQDLCGVEGLDLSEIGKTEKSIRESIYLFSALIVEIINGNVKLRQIDANLSGFIKWLISILEEQNEVDLFTLNFDLLIETILLQIKRGKFIDFHHQASEWKEINHLRYYFNPIKVMKKAGDCKIKLHHLHGSLSTFKDLNKENTVKKRGVYFKLSTEAIQESRFYQKIFDLNIIPSIITGGDKSVKIKESPFSFYFNEFMEKMSSENHPCDKLFIIGYSFRDEHINSAIVERLKLVTKDIDPRPLKLIIVDYAKNDEEENKFIDQINSALGLEEKASLRFIKNDSRILFGGANSIQAII